MAVVSNSGFSRRALFGVSLGFRANEYPRGRRPDHLVSQGGAYQKAQTIAILDPQPRSSALPSIRIAFPTPGPSSSRRSPAASDLGRVDVPTGYCLRAAIRG